MTSRGHTNTIIVVIFAAALLAGSSAQAANLFALGGDAAPKTAMERQIGLFEQALSWLTGAWNGLAATFQSSEEAPPPPTGTGCTENCGDAGPGIDPLG